MRRLSLLLAVPLIACGKGDGTESTGPVATCDDYVTTPMPQLSPDEYPEGLAAGIEALQNLGGLWRGTNCMDSTRDIDLKIEGMPAIPDDVLVVTSAPDASISCGCNADLNYGPDNHLDIVGLVPEFTVFFSPDDLAPVDPGVDGVTYTTAGALFAGSQGLYYRGCTTADIAPYLNSAYDRVAMNIRIQVKDTSTPLSHLGEVTFSLEMQQLSAGGESLLCEITDFEKIPF